MTARERFSATVLTLTRYGLSEDQAGACAREIAALHMPPAAVTWSREDVDLGEILEVCCKLTVGYTDFECRKRVTREFLLDMEGPLHAVILDEMRRALVPDIPRDVAVPARPEGVPGPTVDGGGSDGQGDRPSAEHLPQHAALPPAQRLPEDGRRCMIDPARYRIEQRTVTTSDWVTASDE